MPVNALINETSPYLLQHAHNPVNWYPWGKEAFDRAQKEDKMIIISIGYAACHWCHVMAHESFEDPQVAKLMNENFIGIKVDREERPDVDKIYMSAAQLINGNGGWPLNALALPDGHPFFAATYFPRDRWIQLLQYFINEFKTNKATLKDQAARLADGIVGQERLPFKPGVAVFETRDAQIVFDNISGSIDKKDGGLSSTVKFPMPSVWEWLLAYYQYCGNRQALDAALLSLNKMKDGGIYDQIGGGFARYSTDPYWHIPHFEKMLFDNAQLISLYSHAFQLTGEREYRRIAEETLCFLKRELFDGRGFYSSINADSENQEGKYYVWTAAEIKSVLGQDAGSFNKYFGITDSGNWEDNKNVIDRNWASRSDSYDTVFDLSKISVGKKKLFNQRQQRVRPTTDDKVLTAWNAMTSIALISSAKAFDDDSYGQLAKRNIDFLIETRLGRDRGIVFRNFNKNKKMIYGFLDDYSFFIKSLIEYYQYSFQSHYLQIAMELTEAVIENFSDEAGAMFLFNDARFEDVVIRPQEAGDDVIPSSNSVMADNLLQLGTIFDREDMVRRVRSMMGTIKDEMMSNPVYYSNWARVMLKLTTDLVEVAIVGAEFRSQLKQFFRYFLPQAIFCGSAGQENLPLLKQRSVPGKTMIYVCVNKTCQLPVLQAADALKQIQKLGGTANVANKL